MSGIPDNYSMWAAHDAEMEEELKKLPRCCKCKEHIQDDTCYRIDDEIYCEKCMAKHFRVWTEDVMED